MDPYRVVDPALELQGREEHDRLAVIVRTMLDRALAVQSVDSGDLARADALSSTAPFSHAVRFQLQVGASHALAYVDAMADSDRPPRYAGYSLIRGSLEGSVTALWLLQPGKLSKRVLRSLHWYWWERQDAEEFAVELGRGDPDATSRFLALLERDRDRVKGIGEKRIDVRRLSRTDMITEVQRRLPSQEQPTVMAAWRQASSLAHGNSAVAAASFELRPLEGGDERQRVATPSWAVSSAALRTAVQTFEHALELYEHRASESSSARGRA